MRKYLIVIEKASENYSAFSPDVPGCIATGATPEKAERNMKEAIEIHINGMKEDAIPESSSLAKYCEV